VKIPPELAETLAAAVDEGSLDAAARVLGITPPAVSQRLRTLEGIVGQVLLVRSRPVRPTAAGAAVVRLARQIAHVEADAARELGIADDAWVSLPLAVNADSLATWFLPPLARLSSRLQVTFDLHRDDQDFTAGFLESGAVIGAVTSRETPVAGCAVTPLGTMTYRPVATPAFVERWFVDGVTSAALAEVPLVDFDRRDDLQTEWLTGQGVDPARPPRHRVPASSDFAAAVRLGLGWGLLPPFQADDALASGDLVMIGDDAVRVPLFWQQWTIRSRLLDEVASEIITAARAALV